MPSPIERRAVALLAASTLVLAVVDHLIPKPVPFIRLGLANLPILVALSVLPFRQIAAIAAVKIVGQGIVTGMLFSYVFLFSAAGTVASVLVMYLTYRAFGERISFIGVSVCGAFVSNLSQLALAALIVFGQGALLIAPPLLVSGLVTAVILGVVANRFVPDSRWLASLRDSLENESPEGKDRP